MTLVNLAFASYGVAVAIIMFGAFASMHAKKWNLVIGMTAFAFIPAAFGVIVHLIGTK
jgi:hypothetical protein